MRGRHQFDQGSNYGLEIYCIRAQYVKSHEMPQIRGFLSACTDSNDPFMQGVLHGLALGADLQYKRLKLANDAYQQQPAAAAGGLNKQRINR